MGEKIIIGILIVLAANFLGLGFDWFEKFPWFDGLLHLSGGALMAMLFFWYFNPVRLQASSLNKAILAFSFVALVGVLWEFAEITFLNSFVANLYQSVKVEATLFDTLADLFLDLVGAGGLLVLRQSVLFKDKES